MCYQMCAFYSDVSDLCMIVTLFILLGYTVSCKDDGVDAKQIRIWKTYAAS
jgi:hypothetical protein